MAIARAPSTSCGDAGQDRQRVMRVTPEGPVRDVCATVAHFTGLRRQARDDLAREEDADDDERPGSGSGLLQSIGTPEIAYAREGHHFGS